MNTCTQPSCQIWFLPSLHKNLRKKLLNASTLVLRSAFFLHDWKISNADLHTLVGQATPAQYSKYSLAIALFKVFKHECPENMRNLISFFMREKTNFFTSNNSSRVGYNSLSNRFSSLCFAILCFHWLSVSLNEMKVKCKRIL